MMRRKRIVEVTKTIRGGCPRQTEISFKAESRSFSSSCQKGCRPSTTVWLFSSLKKWRSSRRTFHELVVMERKDQSKHS